MKRARVVIGANFGDEGKGLVTDFLCSQGAGVVVRFNGGSQAGHTVVTPEGERHVFRHIGSGTFCNVPTYLSQFFVCNPILFFEERKELIELGFHPEMYAHPECLVTTPADMLINQAKELSRGTKRHGSCGIGFHETICRSKVDELKLTMGDLWNGAKRLEDQLKEICTKYAQFRIGNMVDSEWIPEFKRCCLQFADLVQPMGIQQCDEPIFEGAQGLLLDQGNKEFFPHVTHSHTGMHNVRILCDQAGITEQEVYYVSRTYLTRHGYGPLPGEDPALTYEDNTNHRTTFQGEIRFARLDAADLVSRCGVDRKDGLYHLVFTHCDQSSPPYGRGHLFSTGPNRNHITKDQPETITV